MNIPITKPHNTANLTEIFSSYQGEGRYLGVRQIFLRFAGCNLNCFYCDTKNFNSNICKVYFSKSKNLNISNPVSIMETKNIVNILNKEKHHSLCLTGGEPLLQKKFLINFLPLFSSKKYLETNGVLYKELIKIIDSIDIIAMDIKLSSCTKDKNYFKENKKFLKIACSKDVFVKIVITQDIDLFEFKKAINIMREIDSKIPLILQPVTPFGKIKIRPKKNLMFELQNLALKKLKDVRVIPQVHKLINWR